MVDTKFVRVRHGDEVHHFALYAGVSPYEAARLLQAAFKVPQHVVGLVDGDSPSGAGVVIPVSLACRAPQMLGQRIYSLLLSDREVKWEWQDQMPHVATAVGVPSSTRGAQGVGTGGDTTGGAAATRAWGYATASDTWRGDSEQRRHERQAGRRIPSQQGQNDDGQDVEDEHEDEDDDIVDVDSTVKIVAFVRRMAADGMLSEEDQDVLESAAVAGDVVINAAYAVAVNSQDLDYLKALFQDIAASGRGSSQGRRLLDAKREMLDVAEELQQTGQVDDDQLVYLQNLILVSNSGVTEAFRVYETDRDLPRLARSLMELCAAREGARHSLRAAAVAEGGFTRNGKGVTGTANAGPTRARAEEACGGDKDSMKATLSKVAVSLASEGLLGALEARVLQEMVSQGNPVLFAAFKMYEEDGNMAELQDTVARTARIEAKRVLGSSPVRSVGSPGEGAGIRGHAFAVHASSPMAPLAQNGVSGGGGMAASVAGDGAPARNRCLLANGQVTGAMTTDAAPAEFRRIVSIATRRGLMDVNHARILCTAFADGPSGNDGGRLHKLLHAAWALFSAKRDDNDAVDSLVRIVQLAVKPLQPSSTRSRVTNNAGPSAGQPSSSAAAAAGGRGRQETEATAVKGILTQAAQILLRRKTVSLEEASCLASPSPAGCQAILDTLELFKGDSNRVKLLETLALIAKAEHAQRHASGKVPGAEAASGSTRQASRPSELDGAGDGGRSASGGSGGLPRASAREGARLEDGEANRQDDNDVDTNPGAGNKGGIAEEPSASRARMELLELTDCMSGDERVSAEEARHLTCSIEQEHPLVMAAYKEYVDNKDVNSLVEALVAFVRPATDSARAGTHAPASGSGGADTQSETTVLARERVVLLMHETEVLEPAEATRVLLLLAREVKRVMVIAREGDRSTLQAFELFETSKNVSDLVETIKAILLSESASGRRLADASVSRGRTETAGSGGSSNNDAGGAGDEEIAASVVEIVDSMSLDDKEAAALRLAISCGDSNVRGALDLFRIDSDAKELKDTLARVARHVLEGQERSAANDAAGEPRGDNDASGSVAGSAGAEAGDNAGSAQSSPEDTELKLQELLQEMKKGGSLSESQAELATERFRRDDDVVMGALDVYNREQDLTELADTLKRLP